jgi:hypothetical protein
MRLFIYHPCTGNEIADPFSFFIGDGDDQADQKYTVDNIKKMPDNGNRDGRNIRTFMDNPNAQNSQVSESAGTRRS